MNEDGGIQALNDTIKVTQTQTQTQTQLFVASGASRPNVDQRPTKVETQSTIFMKKMSLSLVRRVSVKGLSLVQIF